MVMTQTKRRRWTCDQQEMEHSDVQRQLLHYCSCHCCCYSSYSYSCCYSSSSEPRGCAESSELCQSHFRISVQNQFAPIRMLQLSISTILKDGILGFHQVGALSELVLRDRGPSRPICIKKNFPPTINVYTTSFVYLQLDQNLRRSTKF